MSSIDAVIARARRPGAFSERQTFTLARTRAIQKMRHFALSDPHFYVLELIQASIASGATWVTLDSDADSFTLSYIGGGFPETGLSNLFDFLFTSKDRREFAALRALALGVNALLLFEPDHLVIESGDGTLAGTTRMEIQTGADKLEIGRPDQALAGTFIRASGMKRERMSRSSKLSIQGDGNDERDVIEQRCICAPVPIFFNGDAVFGLSSQRIPRTLGYRRQIEFDEGDLFGSLGFDPGGFAPRFRLLTNGVWIESLEHKLLSEAPLGGTINFNALRKTADHARIVRDERLDELWLRIRPYAEMLLKGTTRTSDAYDVSIFGGMKIPANQLRLFLRELGQVVVIPPSTEENSLEAAVARQIAHSLDAELLCAAPEQIERLRVLGGREVSIITPDLRSSVDLEIYTRKPAPEPARPWLLSPIEGPPVTVSEFIAALCSDLQSPHAEAARSANEPQSPLARRRRILDRAIGSRGEITTTIYTPANASTNGALEIRLTSSGREVATVSVISAQPGHIVVAEFAGLQPGRFAEYGLAEVTANQIARNVGETLRDASRRALYSLNPETLSPGTAPAHRALSAIQRSYVVRMQRRAQGKAALTISPVETIDGLDLLALRLLRTVSGRELTLRELPELLEGGHGLIYGVIPEVPADLKGLDTDLILDLDAVSERLLIALLGESAYVRIDARDLLAEHEGLRIRDLAIGLREFPKWPLLVEGRDPESLDAEARAHAETALYAQLLHLYVDTPDSGDADLAEELRRQACRHIQRYLCRSLAAGVSEPLGFDVPIVLGQDGTAYSLREIVAAFSTHGQIVAHYDHGSLPPPTAQLRRAATDSPPPTALLVSPFLFRQLRRIGKLALPFDFALGERTPDAAKTRSTQRSAATQGSFLASIEIHEAGVRGVLGIPLVRPESAQIVLLDTDLRVFFALPGIADDFGVVGALHLEIELTDATIEPLFAALHRAAARALTKLAQQLPEFASGSAEELRALDVLLTHAGRHLTLVASPSGAILPSCSTEIAAEILKLPLFPGPQGLPISASAILRELTSEARNRPSTPISGLDLVVADHLDEIRRTWLERHLHSSKIIRPAGQGVRAAPPGPAPASESPDVFDGLTLCATIQGWIGALRPDEPLVSEKPGARVKVWLASDGADDQDDRPCQVYARSGTRSDVTLNSAHWLVRWALDRGQNEQRALAWLLLAVYAEINTLLVDVTNAHEQEFQRRVLAALHGAKLRPLAPSVEAPAPSETSTGHQANSWAAFISS